ncbi:MAG: hypothetical protein U0350_50400 [Caldilineaceae bacterium]
MIPLTTMTMTRSSTNPWLASIYAGVFTAIIATAFVLTFQAAVPALYIITLLLIGAGPVLGYQIANGTLGSEWLALIGGLIGGIPVLDIILWPILVGALSRTQSIGKLFLINIIGLIIGIIVFLLLTKVLNTQDPAWLGPAIVLGAAFWGGACGALMTAWRNAA